MFVLTSEERKRFLHEPLVVRDEALFGCLSVLSVLVPHYIISKVVPFPIVVTWMQLVFGSIYAYVLGEFGLEFPRLAHFSPFKINFAKMNELAIPALAHVGMLVASNMLLSRLTSVAYYPVAACFAIVAHHLTRFFGCGQVYSPHRWSSMGLLLMGYLIFLLDYSESSAHVVGISLIYGILTALYRGAFMERALHDTRGMNSELKATLDFVGILILPLIIMVTRERKFFTYMPTDFSMWSLMLWGTLSTAAVMPQVKNIISNRLVRGTGQPPWRFLELAAFLLIFIAGIIMYGGFTVLGALAFALTFAGRTLNSLDAVAQEHPISEAPAKQPEPKATEPGSKYVPSAEPTTSIPSPNDMSVQMV